MRAKRDKVQDADYTQSKAEICAFVADLVRAGVVPLEDYPYVLAKLLTEIEPQKLTDWQRRHGQVRAFTPVEAVYAAREMERLYAAREGVQLPLALA